MIFVLQKCAVGSSGGVFIPGSSLPNCVTFKSETHSISFTVPETLNLDLVGFTLWTPYESEQDDVMSKYSLKITVKNQTKGDVWSCNPATDRIRMYKEKHIWKGNYLYEDFILETGDQVEVSLDFGDQVTILETGLTLACRKKFIEIPDEHLRQTEDELTRVDEELTSRDVEVDNEPVIENRQSRPSRYDISYIISRQLLLL